MPIINFQQASKYYGAQPVVRDILWGIDAGHHVGLIGSNGVGKTTILKLITGALIPDSGEITRQNGSTIGYLTQDPDLDPSCTVIEEALRGFASIHKLEQDLRDAERALEQIQEDAAETERRLARYGRLQEAYERAGGYAYQHRAEAVLYGLGFLTADMSQPINVLSGGQKTRLGLAKLLLDDTDLLLLDEPESHLDMQATEWLERYIKEYRGAILLVSHDRYFLDRTVDQIVELENHKLSTYAGNYTSYLGLKEHQRLTQNRQYDQQQRMIAENEEFIRRNLAGQKTKQAQGRRKMLDRLERVDRPQDTRRAAGITFSSMKRSGSEIVIIDNASKHFEDRSLFSDFHFKLMQGERVGIIGPNGCGKTTLLRMILGQEEPSTGTVRIGTGVQIGYYDQERLKLNRERSVLNELWSVRPAMNEEVARNILGRFLFSGEDIDKLVKNLSGGEQGRLALAKLMLEEPNFLILDEPTNHLDIPSRHALENALKDYPGTVLVVSHDRYFLDRVVSELLIFDSHGIVRWTNDYSSYRAFREEQLEATNVEEKKGSSKKADIKKEQANPDAARKKRKKEAESVEQAIQSKEEEILQLEQDLNDEHIFTDPVKVAEIGRAYSQSKEELELLYERWETLTQEIETH